MKLLIRISPLFIAGLLSLCAGQLELDERFLEYRKDGMWLVEFYAPWCGHCKKLEPVYREVAQELHKLGSAVRVGKLDCTRYSHVASEFAVRGFPTIMFVHGDRTFTHRGDRTKEDLIEFALRAQGPTVRKLSSIGKLNEALGQHTDTVFFLYIGEDDQYSDFYRKYADVAEAHAIHAYFYSGKKHILDTRKTERFPTLLVFKDNHYYEYFPPEGVVTASSVQQWVNRERYASFPLMSGPGLNEMVNAARYLVILAVDREALKKSGSLSSRLYSMTKDIAFNSRDKFHSEFQFLWMPEVETVNSIAMSFLATPALMVLESERQLYYLAPLPDNLTRPMLQDFLMRVAEGKEPAFGGTGFSMRIRRIFYDLISTVLSIWQASRWLFLLMFGLPTIIISVICYSLCCMETIDDIPDDEDDEDDEDRELYDRQHPPLPAGESDLPSYDEVQAAGGDHKTSEDKKNE